MKRVLFSFCLLSLVSSGLAQTSDFGKEDVGKTTLKNAIGLSYHSFKRGEQFRNLCPNAEFQNERLGNGDGLPLQFQGVW